MSLYHVLTTLSLTYSHNFLCLAQTANKVIVVFKAGTQKSVIDHAVDGVKNQGGKITHMYDSALLGFSAELPDVCVSTLHSQAEVDYIEPDGEVSIYAQSLLNGK
ncbi:hypothetical protein BGZ76_005238 [Entomortierella beljakovae]|nr:hypothetical protein BGZ76_005238 [Entomortierella beljakovae]